MLIWHLGHILFLCEDFEKEHARLLWIISVLELALSVSIVFCLCKSARDESSDDRKFLVRAFFLNIIDRCLAVGYMAKTMLHFEEIQDLSEASHHMAFVLWIKQYGFSGAVIYGSISLGVTVYFYFLA